jgi:hypothetical protein
MHDARLQGSLALETAVREQFQHQPVLAQNIGLELRDPIRIGDKTQMFKQKRADTAALETV